MLHLNHFTTKVVCNKLHYYRPQPSDSTVSDDPYNGLIEGQFDVTVQEILLLSRVSMSHRWNSRCQYIPQTYWYIHILCEKVTTCRINSVFCNCESKMPLHQRIKWTIIEKWTDKQS